MFDKNTNRSRLTQVAIIAALFGAFGTAIAADDDEWPPAVTSDGLDLVEGTEAAAVWVKEGSDFSEYSRVMIMDVGVGFKKNWRRDYNRDEISLQRQVSKSDAERIKQRVSDSFKDVFTEELEKAGYVVADYDFKLAEADVLVLRPAIMDLVVTTPDVAAAGRGNSYTASAGSMSLYMEFYDSVTSSILARVVDRKSANSSGTVQMSNNVTNKADADRMFREWTALLIAKMDAVMKKDE